MIQPIHAKKNDVGRLAGQNKEIFDLLREGPRTNRELAEVSLKYTSRISDIRKFLRANYPDLAIINERHPDKQGLTIYRLQRDPQVDQTPA